MSRHQAPSGELPDVFVGSVALSEGHLSARQLRGPYVERVLQGVYRPAWVPLTHKLKCQAACLVLPEAAVVTGASAASVLGLRLSSAADEVSVAVPEGSVVPRRVGIRLRRVSDDAPFGQVVDGVRLAHARRIAFDAAARLPVHDATAALDAIVRFGLVDIAHFQRWLTDCHDNDVRDVRLAAQLVDPRAESLPESVTRVHLVRAGFDVVPQYQVTAGSRVVARVDLALPELKIAIEYDGRWHEAQRALDNERLAALRSEGWTVIIVTAELLRNHRRLLAVVSAAVAERRALLP